MIHNTGRSVCRVTIRPASNTVRKLTSRCKRPTPVAYVVKHSIFFSPFTRRIRQPCRFRKIHQRRSSAFAHQMDRSRTRPPYPTLSPSQSSSAYTSSSSLASMPSSDQPAHNEPFSQQSAPLPSPTTEQRQFFGSLNAPDTEQQKQMRYFTRSSNQMQQQQQQSVSQMASQQQQQPIQQQQQASGTGSASQPPLQQMQTSFNYRPDRQDAGATNAQTMAMLADYNLIAEAAKRAQMACMIRDLDEMDMS